MGIDVKEKNTCCAKLLSFGSWSPRTCGKPSKIEVDGNHYCGMHNPIKKAEQEALAREKWNRESEIRSIHRVLDGLEKDMAVEVVYLKNETDCDLPGKLSSLVKKWNESYKELNNKKDGK